MFCLQGAREARPHAWVGAIPAIVFLSLVLVPYYYRNRIYNLLEFIGRQYGSSTRLFHSLLMLSYMLLALGPGLRRILRVVGGRIMADQACCEKLRKALSEALARMTPPMQDHVMEGPEGVMAATAGMTEAQATPEIAKEIRELEQALREEGCHAHGAVQHLEHGLIPVFHEPQLQQHGNPLRCGRDRPQRGAAEQRGR